MQSNQQGFTLVELIVVILLVSILSVYAASRFSGVSSVSAYAVREQAISMIRQIQIDRMQSNLSTDRFAADPKLDNYFKLAIQTDCLGSVYVCSLPVGDNSRSDRLRPSNVQFSAAHSEISFDLYGNPSSSVTIDIEAGGSRSAVCINAQGYVSGC
ncbi:MAG: type II secretion system protein [Vibrio sp.]|uniref:type II secretion system protein n=1 Tax=Vibrio sp. TaxID=678 RepID=UPI003A859EFE